MLSLLYQPKLFPNCRSFAKHTLSLYSEQLDLGAHSMNEAQSLLWNCCREGKNDLSNPKQYLYHLNAIKFTYLLLREMGNEEGVFETNVRAYIAYKTNIKPLVAKIDSTTGIKEFFALYP